MLNGVITLVQYLQWVLQPANGVYNTEICCHVAVLMRERLKLLKAVLDLGVELTSLPSQPLPNQQPSNRPHIAKQLNTQNAANDQFTSAAATEAASPASASTVYLSLDAFQELLDWPSQQQRCRISVFPEHNIAFTFEVNNLVMAVARGDDGRWGLPAWTGRHHCD